MLFFRKGKIMGKKKLGRKTVIFGSRGINSLEIIEKAIEQSGFEISEVVSGCCKNSPDEVGEQWAEKNGIKVKQFPAKWDDIKAKGAVVKTNNYGKEYNAKAGFDRNTQMAEYGEQGIGIIQTEGSPGSEHMAEELKKLNKQVYIFYC